MTLKQITSALLAIVWTTFVVVHPSFAQGDHAREGVNFKIVQGENPDWTYAKISKEANLNTPSFAAAMNTDMHSIRADNPTKTLAVCKVGNRWNIASGIKSPEARATNAIWQNCPEANQYVYLVPGETIVLKGKKHLTFSQKQAKIEEIQSCEDANCVKEATTVLAPDVDWSVLGTQEPAEPVGPVAEEPREPEEDAVIPPVAPALPSEGDGAAMTPPPAESSPSYALWAAVLFGFVGFVYGATQRSKSRKAQASLKAVRQTVSVNEENVYALNALRDETDRQKKELVRVRNDVDKQRRQLGFYANEISKRLFGEGLDLNNRNPADIMDEFLKRTERWTQDMKAALVDLKGRFQRGATISFRDILTPAFVREIDASVVTFKEMQEREAREAQETSGGAARENAVLRDGVRNLHAEFRGIASEDIGTDDSTEMVQKLRDAVLGFSNQVQNIGSELLELVLGEGRRTFRAPYDLTSLNDVKEALWESHTALEPTALAGNPDDPPRSLAGRIAFITGTGGPDRHHKRIEELERKNASLQVHVTELKDALREARSEASVSGVTDKRVLASQTGDTLTPGSPEMAAMFRSPDESGASEAVSKEEREPAWAYAYQAGQAFFTYLRGCITLSWKYESDFALFDGLVNVFERLNVQFTQENGEVKTYALLPLLKSGEDRELVQAMLASAG